MADDIAEIQVSSNLKEQPQLESKNPLIANLKERIKNLNPTEKGKNLDVLGRLRTLSNNPETYELMVKGIEVGLFVGALTGVFGDLLSQSAISNVISISRGMSGIEEVSSNLPMPAKIGIEAINYFTGTSIAGDLLKFFELAPDINIVDKAQSAKEMFLSVKNRLNLELTDFSANSKDILSAMSAFGVTTNAQPVFASA